jgi:glycerol-3-phosphate dehydrogenase
VNEAPRPAFDSGSRERNIAALAASPLDVLIIGGGINGAGLARDLGLRARHAARPLRVGLLEKGHFASGTSSRNSQLIHGGLRYLRYLEFRLVKEALHERSTLLRIAPHLVEPLPLLIPFYSLWDRFFYGAGLHLYDLLAGRDNISPHRYLSRRQVERDEPTLDTRGLHSAAIYYDCQVQSARGVLENIFDAERCGVLTANYCAASAPRSCGDGFGVPVTDLLADRRFTVQARRLVDARGPWEDSGNIRLVRGSHIIVPRLNTSDNAIAWFGSDGRIIFVIPWGTGRSLSLVGTTDVDHASSADDVSISSEEIRYLLGVVRRLFPGAKDTRPVAAYSSLRPLAAAKGTSATAASRDHRIWMEQGIVRIAGGKYTTYRTMSREAADLVARDLAPEIVGRCETGDVPLGGNSVEAYSHLRSEAATWSRRCGIPQADAIALIRNYGLQAPSVFELLPSTGSAEARILEASTLYAVRHEMARRLVDVLFVSTYWGHERTLDHTLLEAPAAVMARELGWEERRVEEEISLALRVAAMPAW